MRGPFRDQQHTFALIDQRDTKFDHIAAALKASATPGLNVVSFPTLKKFGRARDVLAEISDFTLELAPSTIAVGNDRRTEFYAAVRGCPAARRTYIDDGLYSYLPYRDARTPWGSRLSVAMRRLRYQMRVERPPMVGGSRAVQDAYVLLPQHVHAGLRGKPVHPLQPEWFADPWVRGICVAAAAAAGFDAARCRSIGLLLLLPNPRFLDAYPALREQIESLAADHAARGEVVALKAHPRATVPLDQQLRMPSQAVLELPSTLPVEVLAPLLSGTRVVGTLTTALLSLALLGDRLNVQSLMPPAAPGAAGDYNDQTLQIYRSVGIQPFTGTGTPPR